jgi:hypothetical protein
MTAKMAVVFVTHTGHVLAALTRAAATEAKILTADLAGPGLLVRSPDALDPDLEVPADELDVLVTDFKEEVLLNPRAYQVLKDSDPPLDDLSSSPTVTTTLSATEVTVTLSAAPASDVLVWVLLRKVASGETAVVTGKIIPPGVIDSMPQALGSGPIRVLALVAGILPDMQTLV